jgi:thiamine kinase-like enzyme
VDWENSGWGDPAFEIANLITHPAYIKVPLSRWDWVIDAYCELARDDDIATRIRTHWKILLIWWVARTARYLYEIPRGLDKRLVSRPAGWQTDMRAKYKHYVSWAETMYA